MKQKNRMTISRKFKVFPIGNDDEITRVYNYLRDEMYAQYQGLNLLMGQLMGKYYECDRNIKLEEFKNFQKEKMTNSNPIFNDINFAVGCDSKSAIVKKVKQDFSIALKNGLAKGERSITNYKRDFPLMTRARDIIFTQDLTKNEDKEFDKAMDTYIKWVNKIQFKIIYGHGQNAEELISVIEKTFNKTYKIQESSIQIVKKRLLLIYHYLSQYKNIIWTKIPC